MHRNLIFPVLALATLVTAPAYAEEHNVPPEGFRALFNGKDLSGWRLFIEKGNPKKVLALSPKDRAAAREKAREKISENWKVENGVIVNAKGKGPYLETADDFGDFELLMDWKIDPGADSGIYLRGIPQVQIWDPVKGIPAAKVGSGGLYNNKRFASKPLVNADKPAGEWNRFRIIMIGDHVTVWLNDQLVVNEVVLENYWDRKTPTYGSGPLQIQTHDGGIYFRNVFIREMSPRPPESGVLDIEQKPVGPGWTKLFDGDELVGFQAEKEHWKLQDGVLTGTVKGSPTHHYAYSQKEYGDFELHAKVKLSGKKANSGVCIRTKPTSFDDVPGYQIDMGEGYWGCLWDERRDGMVDAFPPAEAARLVKKDDWNHYYVIARGDRIQAWLNGVRTINAVHPRGFRKGSIAFQLCHGRDREMVAQFKDVWVREIDESFYLENHGPLKDDGFSALFNGKDLSNWIGRGIKGYYAENGKLVCRRKGGGNVYPNKEFSNYVFRFEFKLPPGANNGVGVRAVLNTDAAFNGMESQLLENTHPSYAKLAPYQYHGSIYGVAPALRGYQKPVGQWNYQEITANGNQITVKLNGEIIVDVDLKEVAPGPEDRPKTIDKRKHNNLFAKSGYIGFLGHGARIEFRNIRVKELAKTEK